MYPRGGTSSHHVSNVLARTRGLLSKYSSSNRARRDEPDSSLDISLESASSPDARRRHNTRKAQRNDSLDSLDIDEFLSDEESARPTGVSSLSSETGSTEHSGSSALSDSLSDDTHRGMSTLGDGESQDILLAASPLSSEISVGSPPSSTASPASRHEHLRVPARGGHRQRSEGHSRVPTFTVDESLITLGDSAVDSSGHVSGGLEDEIIIEDASVAVVDDTLDASGGVTVDCGEQDGDLIVVEDVDGTIGNNEASLITLNDTMGQATEASLNLAGIDDLETEIDVGDGTHDNIVVLDSIGGSPTAELETHHGKDIDIVVGAEEDHTIVIDGQDSEIIINNRADHSHQTHGGSTAAQASEASNGIPERIDDGSGGVEERIDTDSGATADVYGEYEQEFPSSLSPPQGPSDDPSVAIEEYAWTTHDSSVNDSHVNGDGNATGGGAAGGDGYGSVSHKSAQQHPSHVQQQHEQHQQQRQQRAQQRGQQHAATESPPDEMPAVVNGGGAGRGSGSASARELERQKKALWAEWTRQQQLQQQRDAETHALVSAPANQPTQTQPSLPQLAQDQASSQRQPQPQQQQQQPAQNKKPARGLLARLKSRPLLRALVQAYDDAVCQDVDYSEEERQDGADDSLPSRRSAARSRRRRRTRRVLQTDDDNYDEGSEPELHHAPHPPAHSVPAMYAGMYGSGYMPPAPYQMPAYPVNSMYTAPFVAPPPPMTPLFTSSASMESKTGVGGGGGGGGGRAFLTEGSPENETKKPQKSPSAQQQSAHAPRRPQPRARTAPLHASHSYSHLPMPAHPYVPFGGGYGSRYGSGYGGGYGSGYGGGAVPFAWGPQPIVYQPPYPYVAAPHAQPHTRPGGHSGTKRRRQRPQTARRSTSANVSRSPAVGGASQSAGGGVMDHESAAFRQQLLDVLSSLKQCRIALETQAVA